MYLSENFSDTNVKQLSNNFTIEKCNCSSLAIDGNVVESKLNFNKMYLIQNHFEIKKRNIWVQVFLGRHKELYNCYLFQYYKGVTFLSL